MYRIVLLSIILCAFSGAFAQMLPGAKPVATFMADSAGNPLLMDFKIQMAGVKDDIPFSAFSSRPLMVYYFGPHCPHCQRGYSSVQQIAKDYEQKGLASIAVSVSNASKRDILGFMEQQRASIPFLQDGGDFGKRYGDGYVPRLYLIHADGKVVRYTKFETEDYKDIRADIEKMQGISK
jgi:thiol-disulfide isomerase/thioredoxin